MNKIIEEFCEYYEQLSLDSLSELDRLYSESAVFEDPVDRIQGLDEIRSYFNGMLENVTYCQFDIEEVLDGGNQAFLTWNMKFSHPKLNKGRETIVPGTSHIKFDKAIYYQRDYYDLGGMIYEKIPVLSFIVRKIKKRMAS